ncbi:hypothetical protein CLU97_0705 [Chryseobacterium sp. 7]|uniref:hypothetical protein n=1 Tax=Chryseobacterium sp. 7 TaxID=2035214 RepID=UPI000EAB96BA|nr:hypothetical protein [Chryseobacterium sp. 7]RLJ31292.1 hypothetical protein CLU97_0705 [Chryseobacterium sp. 7]
MKKNYSIVASIAASVMLNAQVTAVGINTSTPTNTLDINGTARVRTLVPNTYISGIDKIVVADASGVLKSVPESAISTHLSYDILFDLNSLGIASIDDADTSASNPRTPIEIQSKTITLTKDALVQINFCVPLNKVYEHGTALPPKDGRIKMLRTNLVVDGNIVTKSTNTVTNYVNPDEPTPPPALTGVFYNTGSFSIKLAAGTHTIKLEGTCNPYISCEQGGGISGARFQAIALY